MTTFAMRGFRGRTVHASHSSTPLTVQGHWHTQGPQVVGGEGGAPEWVADAFDDNPNLEFIAIGTKTAGVVYGRMEERKSEA